MLGHKRQTSPEAELVAWVCKYRDRTCSYSMHSSFLYWPTEKPKAPCSQRSKVWGGRWDGWHATLPMWLLILQSSTQTSPPEHRPLAPPLRTCAVPVSGSRITMTAFSSQCLSQHRLLSSLTFLRTVSGLAAPWGTPSSTEARAWSCCPKGRVFASHEGPMEISRSNQPEHTPSYACSATAGPARGWGAWRHSCWGARPSRLGRSGTKQRNASQRRKPRMDNATKTFPSTLQREGREGVNNENSIFSVTGPQVNGRNFQPICHMWKLTPC